MWCGLVWSRVVWCGVVCVHKLVNDLKVCSVGTWLEAQHAPQVMPSTILKATPTAMSQHMLLSNSQGQNKFEAACSPKGVGCGAQHVPNTPPPLSNPLGQSQGQTVRWNIHFYEALGGLGLDGQDGVGWGGEGWGEWGEAGQGRSPGTPPMHTILRP